jgi:hypothetical protein
LRSKYTNTWSSAAELNLQGVMVYLLAHCLLLTEDQDSVTWKTSDKDHFVVIIMQQGFDAALRLIEVIRQLDLATAADPTCTRVRVCGAPLLAQPKQHFRLAFQACLFLLKYLNYNVAAPTTNQNAARNAVMIVYQVFKQYHSREFQRAARTLEVLARFVVPGARRMKNIVRTRMRTSLNYNAIWTAVSLRDSGVDSVSTVASAAPGKDTESYPNTNALDLNSAFPWGLWADATFDESALDPTYQLFSDFPMTIDPV